MTSTKTRTLLQTTAVLVASILLLACPIDENDLQGNVTVVNNTNAPAVDIDFISIEEAGSAPGADLLGGLLASGSSATYSGYDCATSYTSSVSMVDDAAIAPSDVFIPPCGGTQTVTWNSPGA